MLRLFSTQRLVLGAIVGAIQKVFILGIVAGVVAVALSPFMNRAAIDLTVTPVEQDKDSDVQERDL